MLQKALPVLVVLWISLIPGANGIVTDPTFTDVYLDCDPKGVLLTVNSSALGEAIPGLNPDSVRVGEGPWHEQCRPQETLDGGRGIKTFKFFYGDCHPKIEEFTNTMVRLRYDVVGDVEARDEDSPEGASVTCIVPKDGLIRAKIKADTNVYEYVGNSGGAFQFGMTIYKDSFMTVPVDKGEVIPLGIPLWVGMKLNTTSNSEMFVRDCWATPNPTKTADQPEHMFIKNGLIGEDDETFTPVDDVITATTYGFSFDSFMFRGAGNRVYIKCHVHVCDPYVTDADQSACTIPKYPEYHVSARDVGLFGSGSGSGFGLNTRDVGEEEVETNEEDEQDFGDNDENDAGENLNKRYVDDGTDESESKLETADEEKRDVVETEHSVFFIMHSFQVKHLERKRRSAGSYRIYPKHTMFNNLRSGIILAIIIVSTAMFSACAILLPLHFSGEKVRCLHVKPVKRTV